MDFFEKARVHWFQSLFREFTLRYKIRNRLLSQIYHFSLLICYPYSFILQHFSYYILYYFWYYTLYYAWNSSKLIPYMVLCAIICLVRKINFKLIVTYHMIVQKLVRYTTIMEYHINYYSTAQRNNIAKI